MLACKTHSGKILRKIIQATADEQTFNPPSTTEDMTVLDELKDLLGGESRSGSQNI